MTKKVYTGSSSVLVSASPPRDVGASKVREVIALWEKRKRPTKQLEKVVRSAWYRRRIYGSKASNIAEVIILHNTGAPGACGPSIQRLGTGGTGTRLVLSVRFPAGPISLHAMAHAMTNPHEQTHGKEFCKNLINLVKYTHGPLEAADLGEKLREAGIATGAWSKDRLSNRQTARKEAAAITKDDFLALFKELSG
jgi:hypothetical protein